jgi:NADH-quinone oxidoreductase subunit F
MEKVLSQNWDVDGINRLETYESHGGYESARKAMKMEPAAVIEEVKNSGIRGRGGAGFPAGVKWGFVPKETDKPKYLAVNADEGEPGTFKDRQIMEKDPHRMLEGMIICCWAVGIHTAYVYIRGEYVYPMRRLQEAIDEAYAKGYLGKGIFGSKFDLDVTVHRGAGAYICGEETGLLESLEGKPGRPRIKPPFPAVIGLWGSPTVINNVETLAALPWILENGAEKYALMGTEKSKGTILMSLSGHVEKPGVYEIEVGMNILEFIEQQGGGVLGGKQLKAVVPGGVSAPVLTPEECGRLGLDHESLMGEGSMLGSAAMVVMAEGTSMVEAAYVTARFFAHETCGQCPPCREGTAWQRDILARLLRKEGRKGDLDLLQDLCTNMKGRTVCVLSDASGMAVEAYLQKFRPEFEQCITIEEEEPRVSFA